MPGYYFCFWLCKHELGYPMFLPILLLFYFFLNLTHDILIHILKTHTHWANLYEFNFQKLGASGRGVTIESTLKHEVIVCVCIIISHVSHFMKCQTFAKAFVLPNLFILSISYCLL